MDRKHALGGAGVLDTLKVFRGAEPEISRPNLHAEFAVEKDRRCRASAAEVEYAHAGPQIQRTSQPLGHPQRVSGAAGTGTNPFGIVLYGTREMLQPFVQHHMNS